ncbi:MAG: hypothetical protein P1V35_10470, partial [Planctomycetota bacterium]|nr:hypothetical protein [Planctomycetota bacterium]
VQALFVFGGDRHNCNGYRLEEIVEEPGLTRVRIDLITYQSDLGSSKAAPRFLNPWALMVLPASPKTLVLEENKQSLKNNPAKWKPLATFPGRKGVGAPVQGTHQTQSSD